MKRSKCAFMSMNFILTSAIVGSQLEGIPDSVSEQGMRKGLYQKVSWIVRHLRIVFKCCYC